MYFLWLLCFTARAEEADNHVRVPRPLAALMGGVGFAEVQQPGDAPGFRFGEADSGQVEAAGPEVSAGFKGRYWLHPSAHIVLDATVGAAHIPGAVEVMETRGPVVTFGSITMGLGF